VGATADDEHAVVRHMASRQQYQSVHDFRRQCCFSEVDPQLDGGRFLVDVLPARTRRAEKTLFDLAVLQNDGVRHSHHGSIPIWRCRRESSRFKAPDAICSALDALLESVQHCGREWMTGAESGSRETRDDTAFGCRRSGGAGDDPA
jgi:hypothetical protein